MKQLTCEMCGGVDIIKQDGFYICQHCGTKYTVEEAKKLLIEGTVQVEITRDKEIPNLLRLAQVAHDGENAEDAVRYAEEVLIIDSTNAQAWMIKAMNLHRTLPVNAVNALTIKKTAQQAIALCEPEKKTELADSIVDRVLCHTQFVAEMTHDDTEIIQAYNISCELIEDIPSVSGNLVSKWYDSFVSMRTHKEIGPIIERRWGDSLFINQRPDNRLKKLLDTRYAGAYDAYTSAHQEESYNKGKEELAKATYAGDFRLAAMHFKKAGSYKDAKELLVQCESKAKTYPESPETKKLHQEMKANKAITGCVGTLIGVGICIAIIWMILSEIEFLSFLFS